MGGFTHYTDEQIAQAKNADLAEFVRSHGFDCEKAGREIHVKGYGGLYINPEKNIFCIFSQSKADGSPEGGKGPLAFAQKVMGMSFPEAMREIVGEGEPVKKFTPRNPGENSAAINGFEIAVIPGGTGFVTIDKKSLEVRDDGDDYFMRVPNSGGIIYTKLPKNDVTEINDGKTLKYTFNKGIQYNTYYSDGSFQDKMPGGKLAQFYEDKNKTVLGDKKSQKVRYNISGGDTIEIYEKRNDRVICVDADSVSELPGILAKNGISGFEADAVIENVSDKLGIKTAEKKQFVMPEKYDEGYKNMYAYLITSRNISPAIVRDFANKGLIYPTLSEGISKEGKPYKKINAVFLHKNEQGKPCGADLQGLDSDPKYRFKSCTARDETDAGFTYTKGDPKLVDTVYLFEAPIDLMSFVELHPEIENAKFAAVSGLKPNIAKTYLESGLRVISCVDNDKAGQDFNDRILSGKMLEAVSARGDDVTEKIISDREPPIRFLEATVNDKECSFFLSKSDYRDALAANAKIKNSVFVWVNKSNFTVNRECAEAGVKDFNDLLKKVKSEKGDKEINTQKFKEEVKRIDIWADKTTGKAAEMERSVRIER